MSPDPAKVTALAISYSGTLYGYDTVGDALVRINVDTGAMAIVGEPSGQSEADNSMQSLAFDRRDGTLYGMLVLDDVSSANVFGKFAPNGVFEPFPAPATPQPGIFRLELPSECAQQDDFIFADGFDPEAALR